MSALNEYGRKAVNSAVTGPEFDIQRRVQTVHDALLYSLGLTDDPPYLVGRGYPSMNEDGTARTALFEITEDGSVTLTVAVAYKDGQCVPAVTLTVQRPELDAPGEFTYERHPVEDHSLHGVGIALRQLGITEGAAGC